MTVVTPVTRGVLSPKSQMRLAIDPPTSGSLLVEVNVYDVPVWVVVKLAVGGVLLMVMVSCPQESALHGVAGAAANPGRIIAF